jgi:hypothetical protein
MLVKVPDEMKSYVHQNMQVGNLYRLNNFKIEPMCENYPKFHKFNLIEAEFQIVFQKDTIVVPIHEPIFNFPHYPVVPSIGQIAGIQRGKQLIGIKL